MTSAASCRSVRFLHVALIVIAVAALGRGAPSAQSTPPSLYGLTPIGVLGGSQSAAYDISPYGGVIVGRAQTAGGAYHAFVEGYDPRTDIGALGGTDSTAFGASSSLAVGQAQTAGGHYHAFTFHPRTKAKVDLGTLGGTWSAAYDASDEIVVGGSRIAGDARMRAFQYANGTMSPLAFDLGGDSTARGVSLAEDIVGQACTLGNASCRPFLLSSGVVRLLGPDDRNGIANRVNDVLGVVGSLWAPGSPTRAFYYSSGIMTDLGTLGGASSDARGLNDDGDVVGTAQNAAGQARAFLWRKGVMTDLNTLVPTGTGWVLESAAAISNGGQIVGYGTFNGKRRAFLLTPPTNLVIRIGGTISQHDSNLPPDGIEVGKTIEWTTSVVTPFDSSRILYGVRMTHTLSGPAVFASATPHDLDTCSVSPTVITCEFQPYQYEGNGREVSIRARATGTGAITHHATVSSAIPDPDNGNNSIAPETNRAVALSSFAIAPPSVASGQLTTLEVLLTDRAPGGDAVVKLTSSHPDVAPVPATFIVPGWTDHRQFNFLPGAVSSPTTVQISATYGLVTVTKTLTVGPSGLKQLYLTPTTVIGGCGQSQGRVVLSGSAPAGGAVVSLSNTNAKATAPAKVTVPAGSDSATFTVPTVPVTTSASGVVTASFGGVSQSLNLTVRPIRAQTLTLSSARVRGGTTVTGIVTLECPAVPGAIAVSFTSSNPAAAAVTVPNITIPSGATSGAFSVRTSAVSSETTVTLYAWVFGVRKAVALTVTP